MKMIVAGSLALGLATNFVQPRPALAWGDEGHEVVALVAQSFLEPDVRRRVSAGLASHKVHNLPRGAQSDSTGPRRAVALLDLSIARLRESRRGRYGSSAR